VLLSKAADRTILLSPLELKFTVNNIIEVKNKNKEICKKYTTPGCDSLSYYQSSI